MARGALIGRTDTQLDRRINPPAASEQQQQTADIQHGQRPGVAVEDPSLIDPAMGVLAPDEVVDPAFGVVPATDSAVDVDVIDPALGVPAIDPEVDPMIDEEEEEEEEEQPATAAPKAAVEQEVIALPVTEVKSTRPSPSCSLMPLSLCAQSYTPPPPHPQTYPHTLIQTNQDGQILPADQAPEFEEDDDPPTAMAPPRAANALPKGALANKPALRTMGAAAPAAAAAGAGAR